MQNRLKALRLISSLRQKASNESLKELEMIGKVSSNGKAVRLCKSYAKALSLFEKKYGGLK